MQRFMLKSKLHRATVTDANLLYEGSITIDKELMAAADLMPFEKVAVYNVNNGERFSTYVMEGASRTGIICINGAAARKAAKGDVVIIASYVIVDDEKAKNWSPKSILLDGNNEIKSV